MEKVPCTKPRLVIQYLVHVITEVLSYLIDRFVVYVNVGDLHFWLKSQE